MKERITPHLRALIDAGSEAIKNQFVKMRGKNTKKKFPTLDPLEEEKYSPTKGLVHKYKRTALIKVSNYCAGHCQFCTRCRDIGTPEGDLSKEDIKNIITYVEKHTEIVEIILSGGDPFFTPNVTYELLDKLDSIKSVRVIRIGTRLPVHAPRSFKQRNVLDVLEKIEAINRFRCPVHVLIHFNHPDEITKEVSDLMWDLRRTGVVLFSQTVFLRDVNDNVDILDKLFMKLHSLGVIPYYIYRCDYVAGREHFVVPFMREVRIMIALWKRLPGLALPQYIFDAPGGKGKIRVPYLSRQIPRSFADTEGKTIEI
ncbi:MAG: lysine-2,3-aminomutase [Parcubacteria group bacterium LiPW_41]|nr:MAG: lysine-2,3-aminomutase [Parcubacteria group bacterium LiPW_41]